MNHCYKKKSGFSLAEVLIASFLFVAVGLIAINVFVNVMKIQRRVSLENAIYEDARFLMERIAREVRRNTIDYEEYYNKQVEQKDFGEHYGCYASRFYNPGDPADFGVTCSNGVQPSNPACIVDKTSLDINTGQNPFAGNILSHKDAIAASAFCDKNFNNPIDPNCGDANQIPHQLQDQLYLIDSRGEEKTIFALKKNNIDGNGTLMLSMLQLKGEDTNNDNIMEKWKNCSNGNTYCCADGFSCTAKLESTLSANTIAELYNGFVPISPSRSQVTSLKFLIAPLEDPRKAFGENTPDIQQQPHVTIVLTLEPSGLALQNYSGDIPSITLQTTITSRVYNEVKSFFGENICTQ